MKKDDLLSWGITLLFFGCLFLLKTVSSVPAELGKYVFDTRNFPIVVGLIFLIFHRNRSLGLLLVAVGIFSRFEHIMHLTNDISPYIWPGILIAGGVIMLFTLKKGK